MYVCIYISAADKQKKAVKKPREPKEKRSPTKGKGKKGKKRNPWSDDSEQELSDFSGSEDDAMDGSFSEFAPKREPTSRRTASE